MVQRGHTGFDQLADGGGDNLDPEIPGTDLLALQAAAKRVRLYADEHIAHDMVNPTVPEVPTYGDLHSAIDALGEICRKYTVALTAGWWHTWEPVIQDDWQAIFVSPGYPAERTSGASITTGWKAVRTRPSQPAPHYGAIAFRFAPTQQGRVDWRHFKRPDVTPCRRKQGRRDSVQTRGDA
jgi:hypothetical protein